MKNTIEIPEGRCAGCNECDKEYYLRLVGDSQPVAERRKDSAGWIKYMLDLPIKHSDLKTFCYSNFDADLCAAVIHTAVKMDLYDYAEQYLFSKTGMEVL